MWPTEIRVTEAQTALLVAWEDGAATRLPAAHLWANCRSSGVQRVQIDGYRLRPPADLRILDVRPVGNYAVNLVFSDGRDRGIYPWSFLRHLAEELAAAPAIN